MAHRLHALCIAALAVCFAPNGANACRGWMFEWQILFKEIPFGLDAPFIAHVTIVEALTTQQSYREAMVARVDKVIKGRLKGDTVRLVYSNSSCGPGKALHKVGKSGIVFGDLKENTEGGAELPLIHDNDSALQKRKQERADAK